MARGGVVQPDLPLAVAEAPATPLPIPVLPTSARASGVARASGTACLQPQKLQKPQKLNKLIEWRSAGHLSDSEFSAAKRLVGLN